MKRFLSLALLTSVAILGGCDRVQGVIDRYITPSTATLNGYTVERDSSGAPTGSIDLNVSALDDNDEPIAGEISNVGVTKPTVVTPVGSVATAQEYTAIAEIKFDIRVQEIINAVLDIDQSGSMKKTDPERKRVDAAQSFIERITEQDRLAVMAFRGNDEGLRASSLLQDFTGDQTALNAAVEKVQQKTDTPIWDSVLDTLEVHDSDEGGGRAARVVVLFTDGQRNGGDADFVAALGAASDSDVKFFTVGLGAGRKEIDLTELQTLAEATGGTFANVADADGLEALFAKIFNAIRASGVITVNISPVPPAGSLVTGNIAFDVNGQTFNLPYAVQF